MFQGYEYLFPLVIGYLIGSVPFGLIITRAAGLGDIRKIGSGNIGATNVLRTGQKFLAVFTLFFDILKGSAPVLLFSANSNLEFGLVAGASAVFGHNFPIWLKFKGGKGVATTIGIYLAAFWPVGIATCVAWMLVAVTFRYSSLAALVSLSLPPLYFCWLEKYGALWIPLILVALSFFRHSGNIKRLATGKEPKLFPKKDYE